MTQENLDILLNEHERWLEDRSQGKKLELCNVNLRGHRIGRRKLYLVNLEKVDLSESNCEGVSFSGGYLRNVRFCGANLDFADLSDTDMEEVDFTNALINNSTLDDIKSAKNLLFNNAQMHKATFIKSYIRYSSFLNASLIETNFGKSEIWDCTFRHTDLRRAIFAYAVFFNCEVEGANIDEADFSDTKDLPEEWKIAINWYDEQEQLKRRIRHRLTWGN